jgi:hypothetical protein
VLGSKQDVKIPTKTALEIDASAANTSMQPISPEANNALDFPFESVLQLPSHDFDKTLEKVNDLITAAQPHG